MSNITERLWEKAGRERIPLSGAFELLPMCNLKCRMCYVRMDKEEVEKKGGLLTAEEWLDYAAQAKEEGMLFLLLTGGEPFLRADFFEIYAGMQQMGLQLSINSNGTLIDERTARWLGEHTPTRINITLYGSNEETYEKLCGDGAAFGKVRNAVECLMKYRVPIKFNASITKENVAEMENIIRFAQSLEVPVQVATYMFPPVRRNADMIGENHRLSPEEAGYAKVYADWLQGEPEWFRRQAGQFAQFVPIEKVMAQEQLSKKELAMSCRAGRCSFWLNWQGELGNCGMHPAHSICMRGTSFAQAWQEIVKETEEVRYSPQCSVCPNAHLCHTCIAMVCNECGNENGRPEYMCKMNQASAKYYQEFLGKVYANEKD